MKTRPALFISMLVLVSSLILLALPLRLPIAHAAAPANVRFATFNASLNRASAGQLMTDLQTTTNAQAQAVAEVIQRTAPDVVLINEFDYDTDGAALSLFQQNYLGVGQNGALAVTYPYSYTAESNTGIATGFDLNNNGQIVTTPGANGYGDDAFGFGAFPGQYGMALYSKYPIDTDNIRTFQKFLWNDMPGAFLPDDPATPAPNDWYSPDELAIFRLSSKSHWDIPIEVEGVIVHALVSHPTPPTFDGAEDRNGKRNHDEIRLWSDYINPNASAYIYDDAGNTGGLPANARFVIMGDQNADPNDGDSFDKAILQLLNNPLINTSVIPASPGGPEQAALQGGANANHLSNPAYDTADFADTAPGNLRADYVLPSRQLRIINSAVFWPKSDDPLFRLVGTFDPSLPGGFPTSDHRLVWADIELAPAVAPSVETHSILDQDPPSSERLGDADDPAIWLHPGDPVQSIVIGTLKDGGLEVYDLQGQVLQSIAPPPTVRFNNVDVQYGFPLSGQSTDIAVTTDRLNDKLVIYRINPTTRRLEDVTDPSLGRIFTQGDDAALDNQVTAYGLALYRSPASSTYYAFVSQRHANTVTQLALRDTGNGTIGWTLARTLTLPVPTGFELEDTQVEGMVADQQLGFVYLAQEQVGIWKFVAEPSGSATGTLIHQVYAAGGVLRADAEGLTMYYKADGKGYLLVSSQGDSTFAVFTREGDNTYLGSFIVGSNGPIDSVENSDGADILNLPLGPAFPSGILVTHDGSNDPPVLIDDDGELENINTNFKFVPLERLATSLNNVLTLDTTTYNPRAASVVAQRRALLPLVVKP